MAFAFATCDVNRARGFIQSVYPKRVIDFDAPGIAEVIDLIRRDVIRVTDPAMHGSAQILASNNYTEAVVDELHAACLTMHNSIMAMPERADAA